MVLWFYGIQVTHKTFIDIIYNLPVLRNQQKNKSVIIIILKDECDIDKVLNMEGTITIKVLIIYQDFMSKI